MNPLGLCFVLRNAGLLVQGLLESSPAAGWREGVMSSSDAAGGEIKGFLSGSCLSRKRSWGWPRKQRDIPGAQGKGLVRARRWEHMSAPKRIVMATDFSEHSDRALSYALDIAQACDAQVFLVHVVETIQQCVTDYCISEGTVRQIEEQSVHAAREKMRIEVENLTRIRRASITFDVRTGNPAEEILKEQKDKKADLIVVGSHGRSSIIGHITGSVADKVVHQAGCPVLLVR